MHFCFFGFAGNVIKQYADTYKSVCRYDGYLNNSTLNLNYHTIGKNGWTVETSVVFCTYERVASTSPSWMCCLYFNFPQISVICCTHLCSVWLPLKKFKNPSPNAATSKEALYRMWKELQSGKLPIQVDALFALLRNDSSGQRHLCWWTLDLNSKTAVNNELPWRSA